MTSRCFIVTMQFYLAVQLLLTVRASTGNFYDKLSSSSKHGSCQLYNGTVCSRYLSGKIIYLQEGKSVKHIEKRLTRWFKQNRKTRQIGRECWPHAEALTCMHFYPECNTAQNAPIKTTLCSTHCSFLKQGICKGEFRRAKHSSYFQRFIPLCEEVSFIEDSKGEFCFFLPTFDLKKGPVIYAEKKKRFYSTEGKTAELKCIFGIKNFVWTKETSMMITEGTWYRHNKRVIGNKRMRTKTRQKGKARLFMFLKIHKVSRKDRGNYRCMITFGNKTVRGHAQLIVNNREVVVRPIKGKCTSYNDGVCSAYFNSEEGNNVVYEETMNPIHLVNTQLEEFIKKLKNSKEVSERCKEFGQAVLCYNKFKKCHNKTLKVTPSLCRNDCHLFRNKYCKKELEMISQEKAILAMYIPDCDVLPEPNPDCIPLSHNPTITKKNSIHNDVTEMHCYDEDSPTNYLGSVSMTQTGLLCDNWRHYPGYTDIDHDYCRNFGENRPWCFANGKKKYCSIKSCRPTCYKNRGDDYYGKVSYSKSGKKCLPWNRVAEDFLQSNIDHSYCRNFDNDMEAPWCYVDYQKTRELCDIPKCVSKVQKSNTSVSLVVYIVPAIVGATAVLFSLFLFIFYMKNKKLLKMKKSNELMICESETMDTPGVNTLSTTGSVEYKKESPTMECMELLEAPPVEHRAANGNKKFQSVPEVKESRFANLVKIGDCKLGQLWQGEFVETKNKVIPIVMKRIKAETRANVISEFRLEMNMLRALRHRNLQNIVCVSTMSEVPFIAFEFKQKVDLKEFLKSNKTEGQDFISQSIFQIASGLEYLHNHRVLHKDLAARNCFITQSGHIRISKSELGMCRYPEDYVHIPMLGRAPVRWLSPETLQTGEFRSATDIYMMGVVIWELYSNGDEPYSNFTNEEVIDRVIEGKRLQQPSNCTMSVWHFVEQCWALPICHRPPITVIKENFRQYTPTIQGQDANNNTSNKTC